MRVIERDGVAAVSQRRVASEAGVPPSTVTYYYAAVDDLLVDTLTRVNDAYVARIDALPTGDEALADMARMIAPASEADRAHVVAECELFLMAARRPAMRPEIERWSRALDAFLAPYTADRDHRAGVTASIEGLFIRCCALGPSSHTAEEVHRIIVRLLGRT